MARRVERAEYSVSRDLDGLDLLSARFRRHRYRMHSHPGYVIGVVTGGVETFRCRGARHYARPGAIILVNPESAHDGESAQSVGWSYKVAYPTEAHFRRLAPGRSAPRFAQSVAEDPPLARRLLELHAMVRAERGAAAEALALECRWSEILCALIARYGEAQVAEARPGARRVARDDARIRVLKERLLADLAHPPTLDGLAQAVGLSRWRALRLFKAATGQSPHAFLIDHRLEAARAAIDAGAPIAAAAQEAGFADQSHLTRQFKATFGVTPGAYRAARR